MSYVPPRDASGKIIVGPLFATAPLEDAPAPSAPAPVVPPPAGSVPPPPRPVRDTPTPFGELRPGQAPSAAPTRTPPPWSRWAGYLGIALLVGLVAWQLLPAAPAAPATPTAAATGEAPAATAPPAATPLPTLARAVVAYAEPGGATLGALEAGRAYTVAQELDGWRQLDVEGSGLVWVRAWEMDGTPPPTPTPSPVPTVPVLNPPRPVYVPPPVQPAVQTDWADLPIVGRAESADGVYVCESRISQADAEACLARMMEGTP